MKALITGGAGFIGSSMALALVDRGYEVVILDDLSTGFAEHIPPSASFIQGSVTDLEVVRKAVDGAEVVFHQAASRAVLRSVEDPVETDRVNTLGTLHILLAARDGGARRVITASSSSVYGGTAPLPTSEAGPLRPKSPYAVSKLAGEEYSRVFAELYGLETVALRYFNVFGPRQRPDSAYAAVIPLFIEALAKGERPVVHGDGRQFRDFTYIDDVVRANLCAMDASADRVSGRVFNIARGDRITLLDLLDGLGRIFEIDPNPTFGPPRAGDIRESCADITAASRDLGFEPQVSFRDGLAATVQWFLRR